MQTSWEKQTCFMPAPDTNSSDNSSDSKTDAPSTNNTNITFTIVARSMCYDVFCHWPIQNSNVEEVGVGTSRKCKLPPLLSHVVGIQGNFLSRVCQLSFVIEQ